MKGKNMIEDMLIGAVLKTDVDPKLPVEICIEFRYGEVRRLELYNLMGPNSPHSYHYAKFHSKEGVTYNEPSINGWSAGCLAISCWVEPASNVNSLYKSCLPNVMNMLTKYRSQMDKELAQSKESINKLEQLIITLTHANKNG